MIDKDIARLKALWFVQVFHSKSALMIIEIFSEDFSYSSMCAFTYMQSTLRKQKFCEDLRCWNYWYFFSNFAIAPSFRRCEIIVL